MSAALDALIGALEALEAEESDAGEVGADADHMDPEADAALRVARPPETTAGLRWAWRLEDAPPASLEGAAQVAWWRSEIANEAAPEGAAENTDDGAQDVPPDND